MYAPNLRSIWSLDEAVAILYNNPTASKKPRVWINTPRGEDYLVPAELTAVQLLKYLTECLLYTESENETNNDI